MERLLDDEIVKQLTEIFDNMKNSVALLFFGSQVDCDYCSQTVQLLEEIAFLSDKIELHKFDKDENQEEMKLFNVDKVPGIVIASIKDGHWVNHGIRYAGIPAGYEFTSLIRDILMVSSGDSGLNQETRTYLTSLEKPIFLQVFVTPTCPSCPQAVALAHQMAFESPMVEAEMIETMEFPMLANKFGVSGVPHTTINFGANELIGSAPESVLLDKIRSVVCSEK